MCPPQSSGWCQSGAGHFRTAWTAALYRRTKWRFHSLQSNNLPPSLPLCTGLHGTVGRTTPHLLHTRAAQRPNQNPTVLAWALVPTEQHQRSCACSLHQI